MQANYTSACALMHMGAEPQVAVRRAGQTLRVGSIASFPRLRHMSGQRAISDMRRDRTLAAFSFAIRSKFSFVRFGVLELLVARVVPLEPCR